MGRLIRRLCCSRHDTTRQHAEMLVAHMEVAHNTCSWCWHGSWCWLLVLICIVHVQCQLARSDTHTLPSL
jgi:hypothetical protein